MEYYECYFFDNLICIGVQQVHFMSLGHANSCQTLCFLERQQNISFVFGFFHLQRWEVTCTDILLSVYVDDLLMDDRKLTTRCVHKRIVHFFLILPNCLLSSSLYNVHVQVHVLHIWWDNTLHYTRSNMFYLFMLMCMVNGIGRLYYELSIEKANKINVKVNLVYADNIIIHLFGVRNYLISTAFYHRLNALRSSVILIRNNEKNWYERLLSSYFMICKPWKIISLIDMNL